jgi:hypothetical protein
MTPQTLARMAARVGRSPPERITEADLAAWLGREVDVAALHAAALAVARAYRDRAIGYAVADAIVNDLWCVFLDKATEIGSPFWDVFEAFDAGEYHRRPDRSDDPVAERTDPMIAEILKRYPEDGAQ